MDFFWQKKELNNTEPPAFPKIARLASLAKSKLSGSEGLASTEEGKESKLAKFASLADKISKWNILTPVMKDKHTKTMGVTIVVAAILIAHAEISYLIPERVTLEYRTLKGTDVTNIATRTVTVDELLDEAKIELEELDLVSPIEEHRIENGMTVTVTKCVKSSARIAGEKQDFILTPGTVEENLAYNEVKYDKDDIIEPALTKMVSKKTKIEVKEVHKVVKEKTETVKSDSKIVLDPKLHSGVIEETKGEDGKAVYTYTTTYVNDKKQGTKKKLKKWLKKPVDNTLRLGTSATGESGDSEILKEFTAETTAYYMGTNAHGATGKHCHYGTCAVDPRVIPYGSLIYIEGYGTAVAIDCGGAVKGHIVDLYMTSTRQCYQWGRRYKRAFILRRGW